MSANNPFNEVADPRVVGRCKHQLSDILVIALATYLCGGEDYTDMHSLCSERGKDLAPLVELPNGCPSVDTFERVLQRIEPASLMACLDTYGKTIVKSLQGLQVSIDGKTLRGAKRKTGSIHILSAWVDEYQISVAQQVVEDKENEIVVIPQILDSLDLEGSIVSIDAMGTQTSIAEQIVQSKADYILSLKCNHKHLYEDVKDAFTGRYARHSHKSIDKGHGRLETRTYSAIAFSDVFSEGEYRQWSGLQTIVQVYRHCEFPSGDKLERSEYQYYITSLPAEAIDQISQCIRGHWGIENRLHWQLDVIFSEDGCRARTGYSSINLNVLRKYALAILAQQKDKLSKPKRMFTAALNPQYLKKLLGV
ncbi:MAG: ISAs1 family transposase [Porphyromonas sp.]|nr:ISAs1 family transposase [Porphyromonas sp.]